MNCIILGSGKGTNVKAILESWSQNQLNNAKIKAVLSDNKDSPTLKIANSFSVASRHVKLNDNSAFISPEDNKALINAIDDFNPDLIVLAGFMKILSQEFIEHYKEKVINIHPSLLPSFKGRYAIKKAFEHGVKISGCTVHWVSKDVDSGKIIAQAPVRVMDSDTIESLTTKIQFAEHLLLPSVIANLSVGLS